MCTIGPSRIRKQKRKPYGIRHEDDETAVLEDWMCASPAPTS
jgi:hypothetical protein